MCSKPPKTRLKTSPEARGLARQANSAILAANSPKGGELRAPPLPRAKRKPTWYEWVALALLVGYLALIASYYIWPPSTRSPGIAALSNVKEVCTSLVIYVADNDDVFPAVQSMPSFRAVLTPYARNSTIMLSVNGKRPYGTFNFSLSGVSMHALGEPKVVPAMLGTSEEYFDDPNNRTFLIVGRADSSAKLYKYEDKDEIMEGFHLQFPRAVKEFLPPDYLADKDPFKEHLPR